MDNIFVLGPTNSSQCFSMVIILSQSRAGCVDSYILCCHFINENYHLVETLYQFKNYTCVFVQFVWTESWSCKQFHGYKGKKKTLFIQILGRHLWC
jgi:hypothetical protein